MNFKRFFCLLTACVMLFGASAAVHGAETESDTAYCFSTEDFSEEENLEGVCITELPGEKIGTVLLGDRVIRQGDILSADQIAQMTFAPVRTQEDASASVSYLPIFADHVGKSATMTIAIRGKEDKAPIAEDFALETYKNLPVDGSLKVKDPEEQTMTFNIVRQPKRGEVTIREDGTFTYTPKKNKVGIDSFVFTAADPAGNVSREATVTITIVKPTDATQYTDTLGKDCRFAAEWMKNTGIFVGERVDGNACFSPDRALTRGEFLTMLVKTLDIPTGAELSAVYTDEIPAWLQPYLAAAVRSGMTAGLPDSETFGCDTAITGAEAAVMIQNALDYGVPAEVSTMTEDTDVPEWAVSALNALAEQGIRLSVDGELTRGEAAQVLYQIARMADDAPGMSVLRKVA